MVDIVTLLALVGGFFMAWAIGATNAPAFGPVAAAHAAPIYRGSLLVGIASFLGAVTQGGAVADTVGNRLVAGATLDPLSSTIILFTASVFVAASTVARIPMPSAFLVVGATIGAGYAIGGGAAVTVLSRIAAVWLAIPLVGLVVGYVTARGLRRWVADTAVNRRRIGSGVLLLGAYTAYTAGANQAGLPIGPLMHVVDVPVIYLLVFAGAGMFVGALTGSPRIIHAVSHEYSQLGPRRATGALLAASVIAQTATVIGVPISFGQTLVFSVIGSGLVTGREGLGGRKLVTTATAWTAALLAGSAAAYLLVVAFLP